MHSTANATRRALDAFSGSKRHRRWSLKAQILLLALLAVVSCLALNGVVSTLKSSPGRSLFNNAGAAGAVREEDAAAVEGAATAEKPGSPHLPLMHATVKPFEDLCEWMTGKHTTRATPAEAATGVTVDNTADAELRAQLESTMDRFSHIPADGGDAGRRWSAATGLPLASQRTGEVRVRFLTVNNRLDPMMHFASVTAAMAGVRLEMIGKGWTHFTFVKRMSLLLSYAEVEGLSDADVIVATDADAVMSGEEAESFFAAFVASTAASEEEHMTYDLLDIRMGKRLTPVLFSGETSCWHWATFTRKECPKGYERVHALREKWVTSSGVALQHGFNEANPFKYLNAGVMVSRVWALRLLNRIFLEFARTQSVRRKFRGATDWWCDQSAFGGMYLDLIWWELKSGTLYGAPSELPASAWQESLYPPKVMPAGGRGPHGLPQGFLGVDQSTRLSMTIEPLMNGHDWFRINDEVLESVESPVDALKAALAKGTSLEKSPMGVVRSSHRLRVAPRPKVDCVGVTPVPPECAYRDAVLGIPEGASAVVPLMWHFAGLNKSRRYIQFRSVFPWYTPTLTNSTALSNLVHVLANLPATRVFAIDPETDTDEYLGVVRLLPHNASDDVSTAEMCLASMLEHLRGI